MDIQILKVEGTDVTAQITLDDGTVITPTISVTPYGATQLDPDTGKPVTMLSDPTDNVFNHLYQYGKNYQKEKAAEPVAADFSDLVGQAKSFSVDETGLLTSVVVEAKVVQVL